MPQYPDLAEAKRRIAAINKALKQGYRPPSKSGSGPGALAVAADSLGISRISMDATRIKAIKHHHGIEPDWSFY